jgi:predicted amidophosphoribosyltransferase
VLLATSCPACGARGPAPCPRCVAELRPAPLLPPPPGIDECRALVAYEGAGRRLVTGLKYGGNRQAVAGTAAALAALAPPGGELVTWVPTSAPRRRARGFDQSAVLARHVARCLRVPARGLLRRAPGPPQTGRTLAERWQVAAVTSRRCSARSVVLIDDVVTSGATVSAAARALRAAGVTHISVLAIARTPLKPTTHGDE